jgi:hypothetical protein
MESGRLLVGLEHIICGGYATIGYGDANNGGTAGVDSLTDGAAACEAP